MLSKRGRRHLRNVFLGAMVRAGKGQKRRPFVVTAIGEEREKEAIQLGRGKGAWEKGRGQPRDGKRQSGDRREKEELWCLPLLLLSCGVIRPQRNNCPLSRGTDKSKESRKRGGR